MSNTIDTLGDNECAKQFIARRLVEFVDDTLLNVGLFAFYNFTSLTMVNLSAATDVFGYAFTGCTALTTVNLPAAISIGTSAFYACSSLTKVILGNTEQVATLSSTNAFTSAPNAIIYVPDALVSSYKSATNWSSYSSRIKGLSELPE